MKYRRVIVLLMFLISSVAPCLAHHMAVVVDKGNMVGNVTSAHLAKIFRAEIKKWPDGRDVVLVFHTASAGEKTTLERLLKMSDSELQSLIAAYKNSLKTVVSDAEVLDLVESTPGAVGLVDLHSINGSVNVVKVDGKFPTEAGYLPH
jgi:ABC-type phosphate transport system substrate-binding protein